MMNEYLQRVEKIMREIQPILLDKFSAEQYARELLEYADDQESHFEIRGSHTKSGVPYTFWA